MFPEMCEATAVEYSLPIDFEEFSSQTTQTIQQIAAQRPLAIIRYGSSLYPEDFLPGVSDLDLYVLASRQTKFVDDRLGLKCFTVHPNEFLKQLAVGNSFALCAMLRGKVEYDPYRFVERVWALSDCMSFAPTPLTIESAAESMGNQLSSAMNRYVAEPDDPAGATNRLLRNASKIAESAAMAHIMQTSGKYLTGYTALRAELSGGSSDLIEELDSSRERFMRLQSLNIDRDAGPLISERNELGAAILAAESLYVERADYARIKRRWRFNELLEAQQSRHGPVDRILAVRIDERARTQTILSQGPNGYRLFGRGGVEGRPREIDSAIPDEHVASVRQRLLLLR